MKALKIMALASIIGMSGQVFGADWTPYVKSMKENCDAGSVFRLTQKKLPKKLQADVVKKSGMGMQDSEGEIKFDLKNATAFGQPLKSIDIYAIGDGDGVILTFANADFMKLLPQFTLSDGTRTEKAGSQHFWVNDVEETHISDDQPPAVKILKTHPLTYGKNSFKEYFEKRVEQEMAISDMGGSEELTPVRGYFTYQSGYYETDGDYTTHLEFDAKAKTIACTGGFGSFR